MRPPTDKPIAVVRLESCLQDSEGGPSEYGIERMRDLAKTHYLYVVTPLAWNLDGLRAVFRWLAQYDVPYNDVWAGSGIPEADLWFDTQSEPW